MNTKFRVTLGLVGILVSLIMMAHYIDIIPDTETLVRESRASLSETIAIHATALVQEDNYTRLENDFKFIAERNNDLVSLALRRNDDALLAAYGDHETHWQKMPDKYSQGAQIQVPIWEGNHKWGELELRYKTLSSEGLISIIDNPMIRMVSVLGFGSFILFYFYLGKVLRLLDPSNAIPSRVRSALDTMAEGLLVLDHKEQIALANQAFATMLDKSPNDLLGYRAGDLPWKDMKGEDIKKDERPWVQAFKTGEVQKNRMLRLSLSDHQWLTFNVNCSPVLGGGKKHAGVLVSFDDVTLLENKEIELRKSKEEAESANEAKSAFLANMSHEIRTPMNAILGFTEILKRGYVNNEQDSLRYLNIINASGKNLLDLINDILDLSKVEAGHMEIEEIQAKPHEVIHETLQVLRVRAEEKGIKLEFKARTALPEIISTDPTRLRQMIFNLAGNAIKFTDQGKVTLACRYLPDNAQSMLQIDIIDTGIGMEKDKLNNIFDPFVQADSTTTRRFGGTGLGLTISKRFAEALGGDITVDSEPGKGSVFTISIPTGDLSGVKFLEPAELEQETLNYADQNNMAWKFPDARVLVVDDGSENRELVRFLLEDAGLSVDEAENGKIGADKALAQPYDVILMDVQMPVMDGFSATRLIRKKGLDIPIIALTANAMKGFEQQCLEAGYSGYFSKPINVDQFMDLMAKLLNGKSVQKKTSTNLHISEKTGTSTPGSPVSTLPPIVSKLPSGNQRFQRLISKFIHRFKKQLAAMHQANQQGDLNELASLAHWLKGAGGTVGFDDLTEPAARLELMAKQKEQFQVNVILQELHSLAQRLVDPEKETSREEISDSITPSKEYPLDHSLQTQTINIIKPVSSRLESNPRFHPTIHRFITKLQEQVAIMNTMLQQQNMAELALLAHWLKGSAGTVGYDDFTEPAKQLEADAKAGHIKNVTRTLQYIQDRVDAIVPPQITDTDKTGKHPASTKVA